MCQESGAEVVYFGAFNTILAPIAFVVRLAEKALSIDIGNQERMPSRWVNQALLAHSRSKACWFDTCTYRSVCRMP